MRTDLTIYIPVETKQRLKVIAAAQEKSVSALLGGYIERCLAADLKRLDRVQAEKAISQ